MLISPQPFNCPPQERIPSVDQSARTLAEVHHILAANDEIQQQFNAMKDELRGKCRLSEDLFATVETGTEILRDMKITLVDDTPEVVANKFPPLLVNTNGKARYIFVDENRECDDIVAEILVANPSIILMDQDLTTVKRDTPPARGFRRVGNQKFGTDIISALRKKGYNGTIIGTSSDPGNHQKMMAAGANHCIDKSEPGFCLNIARYLNGTN